MPLGQALSRGPLISRSHPIDPKSKKPRWSAGPHTASVSRRLNILKARPLSRKRRACSTGALSMRWSVCSAQLSWRASRSKTGAAQLAVPHHLRAGGADGHGGGGRPGRRVRRAARRTSTRGRGAAAKRLSRFRGADALRRGNFFCHFSKLAQKTPNSSGMPFGNTLHMLSECFRNSSKHASLSLWEWLTRRPGAPDRTTPPPLSLPTTAHSGTILPPVISGGWHHIASSQYKPWD